MLIIPGRETNRRMKSFHAQGKCNKKSFTPQICTEAEINKNPQMCFANVVYIVNVSQQVQMWFSLQMQMWSSLKVFHCKYFITKCFTASVSLQMFHCKCLFIASVFHCKCFSLQVLFLCKAT